MEGKETTLTSGIILEGNPLYFVYLVNRVLDGLSFMESLQSKTKKIVRMRDQQKYNYKYPRSIYKIKCR